MQPPFPSFAPTGTPISLRAGGSRAPALRGARPSGADFARDAISPVFGGVACAARR